MRRIMVATLLLVVAACGPRGLVTVDTAALGVGVIEPVFIGTMRGTDPATGEEFSRFRAPDLRLARLDVSIPPQRQLGEISWPRPGRKPDPMRDFVATDKRVYATPRDFRADLAAEIRRRGGSREVILFVHGFNTTFAEGTYRFAQLGHDLDTDAALVHFSWPSRGHPLAYVYDRDSIHFARDGLETLLGEVSRAGGRRVLIVGHSMGAFLVMETLRQLEIGGRRDLLGMVSGVVLMSPDIDVDVFRESAERIERLPQPFVIFTSQRDRALNLSARLTGQRERLGNLTDPAAVGSLEVTLVDTTAFSVGSGHFNVGNSPALIKILASIDDVDTAFAAERSGRVGLLGGVALTLQNTTQIILSPITGLPYY